MRTPASGTPRPARTRRTTLAPAAVVPPAPARAPTCFEQHLRDEVVALRVHVVDELGQPGRSDLGELDRGRGRAAECRLARDVDAGRLERSREADGGGPRRLVPRAAVEPGAVDDQGREGRRLDLVVRRLPAGPRAAAVEERLVAEHPSGDSTDAQRTDAAREQREVVPVQARVAEPLEHEASPPDGAVPGPMSENDRLDAKAGAQLLESRERDRELLGRGGGKRLVRASPEESGAVVEVEHQCPGEPGGYTRLAEGGS